MTPEYIYKQTKSLFSDYYKSLCPRRYEIDESIWARPEGVLVTCLAHRELLDQIQDVDIADGSGSFVRWLLLEESLRLCQTPVYVVDPSLVTMFKAANIENKISLTGLKLPFPGAVFCLPKKSLESPVSGEARAITMAVVGPDTEVPFCYVNGRKFRALQPSLVLGVVMADSSSLSYSCPLDMTYGSFTDGLPFSTCMPPEVEKILDRKPKEGDNLVEKKFLNLVVKVAYQIALFVDINQDSEDVEKGNIKKKPKRKSKKYEDPLPFFFPHYLGRRVGQTYTRYVNAIGDRAGPVPHWRGMHWRMQPCGPKNTLRRRILIPPTLVNAIKNS